MINEENIKEQLGHFVEVIQDIRIDEQNRIVLLDIAVDKISDERKSNFISPGQIDFLTRRLAKTFDFRFEVILRPSEASLWLEEAINNVVNYKLLGCIKHIYLSFKTATEVSVIVFPQKTLNDKMFERIEKEIIVFLDSVEIKSSSIELISNEGLEPNNIQILRSVKITAPVTLSYLMALLKNQGLHCPTEKWLASKLDQLRRKGLVVRQEGGNYALSASGLSVTPYGTNRKSSDVERMLYLGKVHT